MCVAVWTNTDVYLLQFTITLLFIPNYFDRQSASLVQLKTQTEDMVSSSGWLICTLLNYCLESRWWTTRLCRIYADDISIEVGNTKFSRHCSGCGFRVSCHDDLIINRINHRFRFIYQYMQNWVTQYVQHVACYNSGCIVLMFRPDSDNNIVVAMQVQFNQTDITVGASLTMTLDSALMSGQWTDPTGVYNNLPVSSSSATVYIGVADNGLL